MSGPKGGKGERDLFCSAVNGYPPSIRKAVVEAINEFIAGTKFNGSELWDRAQHERYDNSAAIGADGRFTVQATVPYLTARRMNKILTKVLADHSSDVAGGLRDRLSQLRERTYDLEASAVDDFSIEVIRNWCAQFLQDYPAKEATDADAV